MWRLTHSLLQKVEVDDEARPDATEEGAVHGDEDKRQDVDDADCHHKDQAVRCHLAHTLKSITGLPDYNTPKHEKI
jgi:hypothetical protein